MRRGRRRGSSTPPITADDGAFDGSQHGGGGGGGWASDVERGGMMISAEQHDAAEPMGACSAHSGVIPYGLEHGAIPSAPVSAPPFAVATEAAAAPHSSVLSLYMVTDKEYQEFLLSRQRRNGGGRGICGTNCGGDDVGRCCAGFSFVGMAFLLFVGTLIERQPLYVKGLKQVKGYPGSRQGVHWSKVTATKGSSQEMDWRYRASSQYIERAENYKMRDESANAFKAAAAYFLTMVLSLIYAQNHHTVNAAVVPCLIRLPLWVYDRSKSAYLRYRRRHYVAIPDTEGSVLPSVARRFRGDHESGGGAVPIARKKRTFELLRRKVVEMSMKISHTSPGRRRDLKTKNV